MSLWHVPREWPGSTVFLLAGGPSVLRQDLDLLRGQRVIAINSAWRSLPSADVLFFHDPKWWRRFGSATKAFGGRIVTASSAGGDDPRVLRLGRLRPPHVHYADDRRFVAMLDTSVSGAANLAGHLGATTIAVLGVDLADGPGGRRHHHDDRYPWRRKADWPRLHRDELAGVATGLASRGIEAINLSPVSDIPGWRKTRLEDLV